MPNFVALARRLSPVGFCQASRTQIMGATAGEKPAAVLEVAFDEIVTYRLAGLVGIRLLAPRASSGEAVLGGGATGTGDLRLELTCDAGHVSCPMLIVTASRLRKFHA
jgi:hypothetical protein